MALFDALIYLDGRSLPPGLEPSLAVSKALAAIQMMPGAGRISVEWDDEPAPGRRRVCVRQANCLFTLDEAACLRIAALIEIELRRALFPMLVPVRR